MSNTTVFNIHWKISANQIIGHFQKSYFFVDTERHGTYAKLSGVSA